ncbi:MAG: 30S ribosomal protein S2 [Microgenomates group bacterium]|nr:30S ribosomal protein S2 [Microgenomates group bacterium]
MSDIDQQIEEMFNAGVHLGHKSNRIHPKAKKFIYKIESGVSIIDLTKTQEQLKKAVDFVKKLAKEGKSLLFVVTKKIASQYVREECSNKNLFFVTTKWPAGLLTNFETIMKNVNTLKKMREEKESGQWNKFVKHEQSKKQKKLNRLERFYGGIAAMDKKPDALFIVDIKKEKNAVKEARLNQIPIVALVDTNSNPFSVDFPIVGNDDSFSSIQYIVNTIISAYKK